MIHYMKGTRVETIVGGYAVQTKVAMRKSYDVTVVVQKIG